MIAINVKTTILIFVLLILSVDSVKANPWRRLSDPYRYIFDFNLNNSNIYDLQLNLDLLYGWKGYNKREGEIVSSFTSGLRYNNDKYHLNYKFVFVDMQAFDETVIVSNSLKRSDSLRQEYVFLKNGFKLLEWNKLGYFDSDITFLRFNTDLIFERRKFGYRGYEGMFLEPGRFNLYFIPNIYLGLANITFDNNTMDFKNSELNHEIFGIDAGYGLELGFEFKEESEYFFPSHFYYISKSTLSLYFDNRFLIPKDLKVYKYGIKLNFDFISKYLPIIISLEKNEIFYHDLKNSIYFFSLGTENRLSTIFDCIGLGK